MATKKRQEGQARDGRKATPVHHLPSLAKSLELSASSPGDFNALVGLTVMEQFINACSEDLAMYLYLLERERGPKDQLHMHAKLRL